MAVPSPPSVLADALAAHAAARADAVALSFEGAQLRYGELFLRCERLAAANALLFNQPMVVSKAAEIKKADFHHRIPVTTRLNGPIEC